MVNSPWLTYDALYMRQCGHTKPGPQWELQLLESATQSHCQHRSAGLYQCHPTSTPDSSASAAVRTRSYCDVQQAWGCVSMSFGGHCHVSVSIITQATLPGRMCSTPWVLWRRKERQPQARGIPAHLHRHCAITPVAVHNCAALCSEQDLSNASNKTYMKT